MTLGKWSDSMREHTFTSYGLMGSNAYALFALWYSFSQRQETKLLSISLFLPSNPKRSTTACPLIRDGPGSDIDAKEVQVYSGRGNAQAEKLARYPVLNPAKRLRFVGPDAKGWRPACMSCLVQVDPMPILVVN